MSDSTETQPDGKTAATNPVSQDGKSASPAGSVELEALQQKVETLTAMLQGLQSDKDKAVAKTNQRLNEFDGRLNTYESYRESGMKPAEARRQMAIDDLLAQAQAGTSNTDVVQGTPAGNPEQPAPDATLQQVVKGLGLDLNNPAVGKALAEKDLRRQLAILTEAAEKHQTTQAQPPNPGAVLPAGGGVGVSSDALADVEAEILVLSKNPSQNWKRFQELTNQAAELRRQL